MQALEIIDTAQSGAAISNLAKVLDISEAQARAAAEASLPELVRGIERNTLSRAGLAAFVTALGQGHHERILDMPATWTDPRVISDGQAIVDHITGSERNTERLAARAMQASGLGAGIIKLLLPILAQWLLGALTKSTKGGLGDILSRLPIPQDGSGQGRPQRPSSRQGGGFDTGGTMGDNSGFDLPTSNVPAGGYPLPWPANPESSPQDRPRSGAGSDLPTTAPPPGGYPMPPMPPAPDDDYGRDTGSRSGGGSPFPFPLPGPGDRRGSDNPYGDLSDILRRGGRLPSGEQAGGRGLGSVVRDTIGSALGFGRKGILGWIVQLVLLRWGWSFLKRILLGR